MPSTVPSPNTARYATAQRGLLMVLSTSKAIANARVKADTASEAFDERDLVVQAAYVDEGPTMKRFRPRAQGRAYRIKKRTSHITVVVSTPAASQDGSTKADKAVATKGRTR